MSPGDKYSFGEDYLKLISAEREGSSNSALFGMFVYYPLDEIDVFIDSEKYTDPGVLANVLRTMTELPIVGLIDGELVSDSIPLASEENPTLYFSPDKIILVYHAYHYEELGQIKDYLETNGFDVEFIDYSDLEYINLQQQAERVETTTLASMTTTTAAALATTTTTTTTSIPSSQPYCDACLLEDTTCAMIGDRFTEDNIESFCNRYAEIEPQKQQDEFCMEGYECLSGTCKNNACIMEKESKGFFAWIRSIFSWFTN